jgi:hypothetical protein
MRASIKTVNLDPPVGIAMAGYSERTHGCTGIHDSIEAVAIALDDGTEKAALVSCDIIGIDGEGVRSIRQEVCKIRPDIKYEHILIAATHTHSSVAASRIHGISLVPEIETDAELDKAYYYLMLKKITGVILWALNDMAPAKIGFGKGDLEGFCTNRNDPEAYSDPSVNVIRIDHADGRVMGMLVNFACHPTMLNHENYLISGDYPGLFRSQMTECIPKCRVLFLQGAAGNVSTRFTKKNSSFEEAGHFAGMLVNNVMDLNSHIETTNKIRIRGLTEPMTFAVKDFPSNEKCLQEVQNAKAALERLRKDNARDALIRKAYTALQGAERNVAIKKQIQNKAIETELQFIGLGVFSLFAIPGDVFGEIGRDLRQLSSLANTIVAGYTNDSVGYIISREGYKIECYERNISLFDARAHETIIDTGKILLDRFTKG